MKKPPTVAIHVAVMASPDFAATYAIIALILDGLCGPGTAARVEPGVGVWEDMLVAGASDAEARAVVVAWIAEQQATITATGEAVEAPGD